MSDERRGAGRPRRGQQTLDRQAIGEATITALTEHGASGLTISKIAAVLDVRSQTLYHHVDSLGDAVNAARGALMARIDFVPDSTMPWSARVVSFAVSYYRAFRPLGQGNSVFFLHEITDPVTLDTYETFLQRAQAAGVAGNRAMQLLLDIEHVIFSLIFEHVSWHALFSPAAIERQQAHTLGALLRSRDASEETSLERLRITVQSLVEAAVR